MKMSRPATDVNSSAEHWAETLQVPLSLPSKEMIDKSNDCHITVVEVSQSVHILGKNLTDGWSYKVTSYVCTYTSLLDVGLESCAVKFM